MKKLTALKQARTWQERLAIAEDKLPGTKYDRIFELVEVARFYATKAELAGERRGLLEGLGSWLAEVIERRDWHVLHEFADALLDLKKHRPRKDEVRETLIALFGMFPKAKIETSDVIRSLKAKNIATDENTRHRVKLLAAELGLPLQRSRPGRPRNHRK